MGHVSHSVRERINDPSHKALVNRIRAQVLTGVRSPWEIACDLVDFPDSFPSPDSWHQAMDALNEDEQWDFVDRFVRAVWNDLADEATAWAHEITDVDRLHAAFDIARSKGVVIGEFTDWDVLDDTPDDLGGACTTCEHLDQLVVGTITLFIVFRSLSGHFVPVSDIILEALLDQDLSPDLEQETDHIFELELDWRPHIEHVPDSEDDEEEQPREELSPEEKERIDRFWDSADANISEWLRIYLVKDNRFFEARIRRSWMATITGKIGEPGVVNKQRMDVSESLPAVKRKVFELFDKGWERPGGTPDAELPDHGRVV